LRVVKDVVEPSTEALSYGTKVHEAAENFIKLGTPLPPEYAFMQSSLDSLNKLSGEKLCEYKMGLTKNLEPCGFFSKDVWWRGVADLVVKGEGKAWLVDYKTGKSSRYADTKQLEILSLAMFKHFPEIKRIKAGLLFVVANDFVKVDYEGGKPDAWVRWLEETSQLGMAYENGVWNAKPNFSCKNFCAVASCLHNGKNH
jgi:hypothetical protein